MKWSHDKVGSRWVCHQLACAWKTTLLPQHDSRNLISSVYTLRTTRDDATVGDAMQNCLRKGIQCCWATKRSCGERSILQLTLQFLTLGLVFLTKARRRLSRAMRCFMLGGLRNSVRQRVSCVMTGPVCLWSGSFSRLKCLGKDHCDLGVDRTRTDNLMRAKHAVYQLTYNPKVSECALAPK